MTTQASEESTTNGSRWTPDQPESGFELPYDVVFGLLSNERRRIALRHLVEVSETTTGELAEYIASFENDKPVHQLSSTERKRVYICLYQCHLPKMDDAAVINFNQDRGRIERSSNFDQVTRFLRPEQDVSPPKDRRGFKWLTSLTAAWGRISSYVRTRF